MNTEDLTIMAMKGAFICGLVSLVAPWIGLLISRWFAAVTAGVLAAAGTILFLISDQYMPKYNIRVDLLINGFLLGVAWVECIGLAIWARSEHSAVSEIRVEPDIEFLSEQDGLPEKWLTGSWLPVLTERGSVRAAYLAIVSYDRGVTSHRALCIRSTTGDDPAFVDKLAAVFEQTGARGHMLDIMFVSAEQEQQLKRVCKPFYEVTQHTSP